MHQQRHNKLGGNAPADITVMKILASNRGREEDLKPPRWGRKTRQSGEIASQTQTIRTAFFLSFWTKVKEETQRAHEEDGAEGCSLVCTLTLKTAAEKNSHGNATRTLWI